MFILVAGLMMNLVIARLTKFKYVFLTVHHSFFMACLLSAVLGTIGLSGVELVLAGGFLLGPGAPFHRPLARNIRTASPMEITSPWAISAVWLTTFLPG